MDIKNTEEEFSEIVAECRNVYKAKMQDYGPAWRILRPASLTDQILIKARRIRNIQIQVEQKVEDNIRDEFIGIVNYSVMALVQLEKGVSNDVDMDKETATALFDTNIRKSLDLMINKNHDYGEAWRNMRLESITDIILMKLNRVKQIEDNNGKTSVSEGLEANYMDLINYAVFALILSKDTKDTKVVSKRKSKK